MIVVFAIARTDIDIVIGIVNGSADDPAGGGTDIPNVAVDAHTLVSLRIEVLGVCISEAVNPTATGGVIPDEVRFADAGIVIGVGSVGVWDFEVRVLPHLADSTNSSA